MKANSKLTLLFFFFLIVICSCGCHQKGEIGRQTDPLQELNKMAHRLPGSYPLDYPDRYFEKALDGKEVEIIGLGEGTHGTREFFEIKHRLIRYLVEHKNFRALAYEFSFSQSLDLNTYISQGQGDLDSLLNSYYWIQCNQEFRNLIEWMKTWNQGRNAEDRLHFIGIDSQMDMLRLEKSIDRLRHLNEELYAALRPLWNDLKEAHTVHYREMNPQQFEHMSRKIIGLQSEMENRMTDFPRNSRLIQQGIHAMLNSHQLMYAVYQKGENPRDRQMADNVEWVKDYLGEDTRIIVWAHNAHIGRNPLYHQKDGGAMGVFLDEAFGNKYLPIATSFSEGSFIAVTADEEGKDTPPHVNLISKKPPEGSCNALLSQCAQQNYFLKFKELSESSPLRNYLNSTRSFIDIGDFYVGNPDLHYSAEFDAKLNLIKSFDLLFYFHETHAIKLSE